MSKSYAQMADEILSGALTDPSKNPMDPSVGHQAHMPAMNPSDTLLEMNDSQRAQLMNMAGVPAQEKVIEETVTPVEPEVAPTTSLELTPQELETLSEAKRIIEKIQEMTSVGCIGVNMAGGVKGDPKQIKLPGDTKTAPKKRTKKKVKTKATQSDFLSYLKA